jgi:ribonuclease-3
MGSGDFELSIGHRFSDPELLRRALTHRSYGAPHNEPGLKSVTEAAE